MRPAESFSADYQEARLKFVEEVTRAGGDLASFEHPEFDPDGSTLFVDAGWFGPRSAEKVLVTVSGTHGVEGFCGSGGQIDWLRRGESSRLPNNLAVLMIHAINPYGFAWLRRVTHENIDLNRNWIDFSNPLPQNPAYDQLSSAICPEEWTTESIKTTEAALLDFVTQHGQRALQIAVHSGQYRHPLGIFYGGRGPSWSRETHTRIYADFLCNAACIAVLDYHTGLGPWGYATKIVPAAHDSDIFARARSWFGLDVVTSSDGSSPSTPKEGGGSAAAPSVLPRAKVTMMTLEVGTVPPRQVFTALRADAWLHAHGDPTSPFAKTIKKQIRDAYYVDSDDWKGMVAAQSLVAMRQAIAGLQSNQLQ